MPTNLQWQARRLPHLIPITANRSGQTRPPFHPRYLPQASGLNPIFALRSSLAIYLGGCMDLAGFTEEVGLG